MLLESYAPVIIPTLNRYNHFRHCLESLEMCTGANLTDVYVGLDYPPSEKYVEGWKQIDKYLQEKVLNHGFKNLIVVRRDYNCGALGVGSNYDLLTKEVFRYYDSYIFSEDDNIFSPCFLEYINKCLDKYKENKQVTAICGFTHQEMYNIGTKNVFCGQSVPAYGVGFWKDIEEIYNKREYGWVFRKLKNNKRYTWRLFKTHPSLVFMLVSMIWERADYGDLRRCFFNVLDNTFSISPTISLVRNIGGDGSGLHSGYVKGLDQQEILTQEHFEPDDIELGITEEYKDRYRMRNMPSGFFARQFNLLYKFIAVSIFLWFDNRENADEPFNWVVRNFIGIWKRGAKMKTSVNRQTYK